MPSAFTIEGNRRVCRRHGKFIKCKPDRLGSAASEHRESAESYKVAFDRSIRDTRSRIDQGMCTRSLQMLMDAAQMRQGYAVHANAFRQGQKARSRTLKDITDRLQFAMHAFARKCLF